MLVMMMTKMTMMITMMIMMTTTMMMTMKSLFSPSRVCPVASVRLQTSRRQCRLQLHGVRRPGTTPHLVEEWQTADPQRQRQTYQRKHVRASTREDEDRDVSASHQRIGLRGLFRCHIITDAAHRHVCALHLPLQDARRHSHHLRGRGHLSVHRGKQRRHQPGQRPPRH